MTVPKKEASAIDIVLARMETHPEEFYGEAKKWAFIYKEYFRDIMTENEKAALHTKLKEIRRAELTGKVLETITADDEAKNELDSEVNRIMASKFGSTAVRGGGSRVEYVQTKSGGTGMVIVNTPEKTTVFK